MFTPHGTYDNTFNQPIVVTGPPTFNNSEPFTAHIRNISQISFNYLLQEQQTNPKSHILETIGYIARKPIQSNIANFTCKVDTISDSVSYSYLTLSSQTEFPDTPFFISGMQSYNGVDTSTVRNQNVSRMTDRIKTEEKQPKDSETTTKPRLRSFCHWRKDCKQHRKKLPSHGDTLICKILVCSGFI